MTRALAVVAALFATLAAAQSNQTLLTVPGISGSGLTGRIVVTGWSFVAAPATAGSIKVSSLAINQIDDESAPLLLKAYAKGTPLGDLVLERFDGAGARVVRLTLARATVSSMSTSGTRASLAPSVQWTVRFTAATLEMVSRDSAGREVRSSVDLSVL
jgi:type VI protein secretion system component Hcp